MKRYTVFVLISLLTFAPGCSKNKSSAEQGKDPADHSATPNPKKEASSVNVPRGAKNSLADENSVKDLSCIISMPNDSDISIGEKKLTKDLLGKDVGDCLARQRPFEKVVYIKADDALEYGNIVDVLHITRKVQGDKIRFIVSPTDGADNPKNILEVKVPDEPRDENKVVKPNPLTLIVFLTKDGRVKINQEDQASLENAAVKLKEVFNYRESNGILREGTNEVEKTVFIKAPRSMKYGEIVKAIDVLKGSGANPIGLQIDDLMQ